MMDGGHEEKHEADAKYQVATKIEEHEAHETQSQVE
jgi:hypothetical protein